MAKYIKIESPYTLNKNRVQAHYLEKYYEILDRQEQQHLREFHREKIKLKKFLRDIRTSTGSLEETSLARRFIDGSNSYRREMTSFPVLKRERTLSACSESDESEGAVKPEEQGLNPDEVDQCAEFEKQKSYTYIAAQIQARTRTNAGRKTSRGSLSSHFSTLADTLNTKVRTLKPLPVTQSNRLIFSQFKNLEEKLTYGSLSKQRTFSLPGHQLSKEGAKTRFNRVEVVPRKNSS